MTGQNKVEHDKKRNEENISPQIEYAIIVCWSHLIQSHININIKTNVLFSSNKDHPTEKSIVKNKKK